MYFSGQTGSTPRTDTQHSHCVELDLGWEFRELWLLPIPLVTVLPGQLPLSSSDSGSHLEYTIEIPGNFKNKKTQTLSNTSRGSGLFWEAWALEFGPRSPDNARVENHCSKRRREVEIIKDND